MIIDGNFTGVATFGRKSMAIKSVDIENIMAFQTQWRKNNGDCNEFAFKEGDKFCEAFHLRLCDGINVIIGENGVG